MIKFNNKPYRCQCINVINNKRCLNRCKTLYLIKEKLYCNMHCQYYRNIFVITIQSLWRGFKIRRLLNNVYKKLPDDLQIKILYFVKRDTYQKRYNNTIRTLVELKIALFYSIIMRASCITLNNSNIFDERNFINFMINNEKEVIEITRLFNKYFKILSDKIKNLMLITMKHLFEILNSRKYLNIMSEEGKKYKKLKNIALLCLYKEKFNFLSNNN